MRPSLRLLLPLLALTSIARSETWTGVVVDPAGAPLSGVVVGSTRSSIVATSGADGSWSLALSSGIAPRTVHSPGIGWNGSELEVDLARHQTVAIEILDASGRRVGPALRRFLPAGRNRIALAVPPARATWIAVRVEGKRTIVSSRSWSRLSAPPSQGAEAAGRLAAADSDTLQYSWKGKLWRAFAISSSPVTGRRDTLDVSASAISWRPSFRLFQANGLPAGYVSALRQLGDTLFAAVDSQIFSVPVAGGAWKLERTIDRSVLDLAASGDTLFAALESWGDGEKTLLQRRAGAGWSEDPWARRYERYRLDEWHGQLWLATWSGQVFRHGDDYRRAETGTSGEVQSFSVIDSTRYLVNQMSPTVFDGADWVFPYFVYGNRAIWWNGRVVFLRQLQYSGHWGLFTWVPGDRDPIRMPDSLYVHPTDFAIAGLDLFSAVGMISGGSMAPHAPIDGVLHHRPGSRICEVIAVPADFAGPVSLGAGNNRLWVGSGNGKVGWLE